MQRDDDQKSRVECHERVRELQDRVPARPQDQIGRLQQPEAAQPRMGSKGEHEDGRHGDQGAP
jgi:hypothetical protein